MLLRPNNFSDRSTRQDFDRTGWRIPLKEKLRYKCNSFRRAAAAVRKRLTRSVGESVCINTFKTRLGTFNINQLLLKMI